MVFWHHARAVFLKGRCERRINLSGSRVAALAWQSVFGFWARSPSSVSPDGECDDIGVNRRARTVVLHVCAVGGLGKGNTAISLS